MQYGPGPRNAFPASPRYRIFPTPLFAAAARPSARDGADVSRVQFKPPNYATVTKHVEPVLCPSTHCGEGRAQRDEDGRPGPVMGGCRPGVTAEFARQRGRLHGGAAHPSAAIASIERRIKM